MTVCDCADKPSKASKHPAILPQQKSIMTKHPVRNVPSDNGRGASIAAYPYVPLAALLWTGCEHLLAGGAGASREQGPRTAAQHTGGRMQAPAHPA